MNWNRLKNFSCPNCNSFLKDIGEYYACIKKGCIFSINKNKFQELTNKLYKPKPKFEIEDNLSELNNL